MGSRDKGPLRELLSQVVPGSPLREGLDRILASHMGALIVLGDGPDSLRICSGGFHLDTEMTPQRLSELAKMDGAIVLNRRGARIAWANVHLVPDPTTPTTETGTRHRTAERVARSVDVPVVAVSEEMGTITLYRRHERRQLQATDSLIARANHLLRALERLKARLDEECAILSAAELAAVVTARQVAAVLQRIEVILRVSDEVADLLDELGEHGRLLTIQLEELVTGVTSERRLILEDYLDPARPAIETTVARLRELSSDELVSLEPVLAACGTEDGSLSADRVISARGLRFLQRLPQVSEDDARLLVGHFGNLHGLVRAPLADLAAAGAMSAEHAVAVKNGIDRLAESSILEPRS